MKDSTIDKAHVQGQAMSIEMADSVEHYNQVSSKDMYAYFEKGEIYRSDAVGNVQSVFYPIDDKDSTFMGMNYIETNEMKMYLKERKMQKIWTTKADATFYPMTQIPPDKLKLNNFAWFDYIRPLNKEDIFNWRGKASGQELKVVARHTAPLQTLSKKPADDNALKENDDVQPVQSEEAETLSP